jgi:hypothetical protein
LFQEESFLRSIGMLDLTRFNPLIRRSLPQQHQQSLPAAAAAAGQGSFNLSSLMTAPPKHTVDVLFLERLLRKRLSARVQMIMHYRLRSMHLHAGGARGLQRKRNTQKNNNGVG